MTVNKNVPINTDKSPGIVLDLIYKMKIKDVMNTDLVTAAPATTLSDIKVKMKEQNVTGIPLIKSGRLMGIISIDDIFKAIDNGYINEPAEKHMTKKLVILEDDMPLAFGISYFNKFKFGRFPVVNKENKLVGILSSRDINVGLLTELNKEIEKLEKRMSRSESKDIHKIRELYRIRKYDFEHAGRASNNIKKLLVKQDFDRRDIRRIATAMYEMEMNLVVHSEGGIMRVIIDKDKASILTKDTAPGIENPDLALKEGYSTANEWIKSLGFGAGMGLPNIQRVSDEFSIKSKLGGGTSVKAVIYLNRDKSKS